MDLATEMVLLFACLLMPLSTGSTEKKEVIVLEVFGPGRGGRREWEQTPRPHEQWQAPLVQVSEENAEGVLGLPENTVKLPFHLVIDGAQKDEMLFCLYLSKMA